MDLLLSHDIRKEKTTRFLTVQALGNVARVFLNDVLQEEFTAPDACAARLWAARKAQAAQRENLPGLGWQIQHIVLHHEVLKFIADIHTILDEVLRGAEQRGLESNHELFRFRYGSSDLNHWLMNRAAEGVVPPPELLGWLSDLRGVRLSIGVRENGGEWRGTYREWPVSAEKSLDGQIVVYTHHHFMPDDRHFPTPFTGVTWDPAGQTFMEWQDGAARALALGGIPDLRSHFLNELRAALIPIAVESL